MKKTIKKLVSLTIASVMLLYAPLSALAEKSEADAAKAAEEEKVWESVEAFGEQFAETNAQTLSDMGIETCTNDEPTVSALSETEGTYSEVLDINTVDELLAINNHRGGYYHLRQDLDLSDTEWTPINLNDAVFDGHGHTISGMTINTVDEEDMLYNLGGLFVGGDICVGKDIYVRDVNLQNFKIDLDLTGDRSFGGIISPLGGAQAEDCKISGSIDVKMEDGISDVNIYALRNAVNTRADVDMNISSKAVDTNEGNKGVHVYGMESCVDCTLYGDIDVILPFSDHGSDETFCAISSSSNCKRYGDISFSSSYFYGISSSDNCKNYGEIDCTRVYERAYCIYASEGCAHEGDMEFDNMGYGSIIYLGTDCTAEGDIRVKSGSATIIERSEDCTYTGDVTAAYGILGIYGTDMPWLGKVCKNCRINGDLTADKDSITGIFGAEDCVINGDLTSGSDDVTGIDAGTSCMINGNLRAGADAVGMQNEGVSVYTKNSIIRGNITGETATGIDGGSYCTVIGNITATDGRATGFYGSSNTLRGTVKASHMGFSGTASSSARVIFIIQCDMCGTLLKTEVDDDISDVYEWQYMDYGHCYYDRGGYEGEDYVPPEPASASMYRVLAYYGPAPESGGEGGGEYTPTPTAAPKSYIMQIIDTRTQDPVSGADVTIDNERYLSDTNGMVRLEKAPAVGMLKIELGGSVIYTDNEFSPVANTINKVYVKGLSMDADDLDLGNSDDAVMEGPSVNLFGRETPLFKLPLSVDVKFFKRCEIAYDKDENIYQVIIDMGEEDDDDEEEESSGGSKKIKDAKSASWTDKFNEAKLEYELAENVNLGVEFNPKEGVGSKLGIDGKISAATFLELRPEGDGLRLLDGGAYIKFEGQYKGGVHLPPPVSVVYLAFGVTGEFLADAKLTLKEDSTFANPKFGFAADINAELTPSLGVGLGAQEKLCVEAGVKGKFDMELGLPMTKLEEKLKINFTGQAYFLAMFVVGKVGLDWDFYEDQLYPNTGGGVGPMSIDDLGDFELIDRSYLDAPMPASLDDVKSVVYPYGSVQTAKLSDGRVVMVWLDDDQSRNVVNKTALYYSVLDSGEWSAPAQIENDGTADFGFDLKAYDDKAAIVWQDTGRTFEDNGDTAALINDMANASELSYSVFNGSAWSSSTAVTNGNSDYEYIPSLYYDGKTAYIAWAQNASGSALPQTDDALVYAAQVKEDGSVDVKQKYDGAMSVYSIAAGENGSTAVVIDKDKNPETEDYTLLVNGIKGTNKTTEYDTANAISGLRFVDDKYYFTEDGAVRSIDAASDPRIISEGVSDGAAYMTDGTNTAVIYELQDTQSERYTSNLYASYYNDDDDEWTNPVQITDFDEKIRSWDAYFNDDGEISISAVLANINTEGAEIVDTARLVHVGADPIADMAVTSLAAAEDITPGGKADFVITAVNNSITDISSVNVTLTGEKSGEIYNGEVDVNIPAGESEKITVRADIPDDFTSQEVTAAVSTSDIADLYAENDSVTADIGYGNLSVELRDYNVISDGEAEVIVKNTGCDAVTGASLKVTDENGSEIYTDDLGTMAGGETRKITVPIAEHYYAFTDEYTSFAMTAAVTAESGDALKYDNEYSCRVYRRTAEGVRAAEDQIVLSAGETYQARFNVYPAEFADDTTIYYTSSDTSVAGVDENGMITAIANGTAKITAMIDGAETTAKMTVYVRDMGKPEITEAMYDYGFIEIDIDTSACLANGEKELLIVAAYAEDGSLMGVEMSEVTGPSEREYMSMWADSGKPKTIKAMIWSGTDGMKPMSLTDTAEVQERSYD